MNNHQLFGEFAALFTAFCWTATALAFESATKKVGSLSVNIIRLVLAFIFLSLLNFLIRGIGFPADAGMHQWIWLGISGIIGFVIGDLFLFASYPLIGSRIAMLVMTLVPPLSAIIGYLFLGEILGFKEIAGMTLVVGGISLAIFSRGQERSTKISLNHPVRGLLFAFIGAIGQATGLVFSKYGMADYNAFAATQIRIIAGISGFVLLVSFSGWWGQIFNTLRNKQAMKGIATGSFFGPFLGVSFSLIAIKYTSVGVAFSLMSIVPVLIIPPVILIFKQKVKIREIAGAVISIAGVCLLFI